MRQPQAYLIRVDEFVVIASDERDVREMAAEAVREGARVQRMTPEELRAWGSSYPMGSWSPDRELTCFEIAEEMDRCRILRGGAGK